MEYGRNNFFTAILSSTLVQNSAKHLKINNLLQYPGIIVFLFEPTQKKLP